MLHLTPVTRALLIVTGVGLVLSLFAAKWMVLVPTAVAGGQIWRLATYPFVMEVNFFSVLFAGLMIFFFGAELEATLGVRRFVNALVLTVLVAGALHLALYWGTPVPLAGLTAITTFLIVAFGTLFPQREILLFGIIPLKAWMLAAGAVAFIVAVPFIQSGFDWHVLLGDGAAGAAVGFAIGRALTTGLPGATAMREVAERVTEKVGGGPSPAQRSGNGPRPEFRLDDLLDKISRQGLDSLTPEERQFLDRTSRRMR